MQAAFLGATDQLKEERERTKKAEEKATMYQQKYEFVLTVAKLTDAEASPLNKEEPILA